MNAQEIFVRLVAQYKPNVSQGNFMGDVVVRGRNEGVRNCLLALGYPEAQIDQAFQDIDDEDNRRRDDMLDRVNGR